MATMKFEIPLLDRSTKFSFWQVKMCVVLARMDLDEALLGLDNMSSLTKEEKERKDRKDSPSFIESDSARHSKGEDCR